MATENFWCPYIQHWGGRPKRTSPSDWQPSFFPVVRSLPHLEPASAFPTLCWDMPTKSSSPFLRSASSSPLSTSRDDAGNSSSLGLVTLWVRAHSNELGTDIGSDAEPFCTQYSSLAITGLSSSKFKIISSPLKTNCVPLHLFSIYRPSPLSNTTKL